MCCDAPLSRVLSEGGCGGLRRVVVDGGGCKSAGGGVRFEQGRMWWVKRQVVVASNDPPSRWWVKQRGGVAKNDLPSRVSSEGGGGGSNSRWCGQK